MVTGRDFNDYGVGRTRGSLKSKYSARSEYSNCSSSPKAGPIMIGPMKLIGMEQTIVDSDPTRELFRSS